MYYSKVKGILLILTTNWRVHSAQVRKKNEGKEIFHSS